MSNERRATAAAASSGAPGSACALPRRGAAHIGLAPHVVNVADRRFSPAAICSASRGFRPREITALLDLADDAVEISRQVEKKRATLRGRTQINLFFEPSTRTQSSFELAGKRLGADVMNMAVGTSSVKKGETLIDTAITLNAMRPDIIVVRHSQAGAVHLLARKVDCSVVNAGDGAHEHPTQALLDALTIRRNTGRIEGLIVAICGDILHSRVARSNIILLTTLGAHVRVVGPSTLMPAGIENMGVEVHRDMKSGLKDADIVMMLRLQRERMNGAFVPSTKEYFRYFGLDEEKLRLRQAGRAGHASRADEPRRRDRFAGRRRRAVADPRTGRDGRRGADGGAGSAGAAVAERVRRGARPVSARGAATGERRSSAQPTKSADQCAGEQDILRGDEQEGSAAGR